MKPIFFLLLSVCAFTSLAQVQIFEPGLISNDEVFGAALSPDGELVVFVKAYGGRDTLELHQSGRRKNKWQEPEPVFFAIPGVSQIDPAFSPDGGTLLFNQMGDEDEGYEVWQVHREDDGWSEPEKLSGAINTTAHEFYATMAVNRNIYFVRRGESNDIFMSEWENGAYAIARPLAGAINTEAGESNPAIAPNENFIIFTSVREEGFGGADLYISFNKGGVWSEPINLGDPINSIFSDFCPSFDYASDRFVFSRTERIGDRRKENIYTVPMEQLKVDELRAQARWVE